MSPVMDHLETPPTEAASPRRATGPSWLVAVRIAFIGAAGLAFAETSAAALLTARHFGQEGWPLGLIAAAAGKTAVTHALVWLAFMSACAGVHWLAVRSKPRSHPEPLYAACLIVGMGLIAGPANLRIMGRDSALWLITGAVIVAAAAFAAHRILRRAMTSRTGSTIHRWIGRIAVLSLAFVVISGTWFAISPLFSPASWRVPTPTDEGVRSKQPNVLWIVLDTVRPDRMSCYGYDQPTTPFLDQWSKCALVFDRAASNAIWTVPAHASMFTGRSVREHGMDFYHLWLDDEVPTVADALDRSGYATAAFSNNPWVSRYSNLTHGFATARNLHYLPRLGRSSIEYLLETQGVTPPVPWLDNDGGAAVTNHLIDQWLDSQTRFSEPFMLFVNYMDAHLPYRVPARYRRMFMNDEQVARSYELRWKAHGHITHAMSVRYNIEGPEFIDAEDIEILKRQYDAAIRYLDDRLAELIGMFQDRGLLENTLVIIASDHGEYLATHNMWDHRYLTYDDVTRVALLISAPGEAQGIRVSTPALLSDLYPTILEYTLEEIDTPPGFGARNLLKLARDRDAQRMILTEYAGPTPTTLRPGANRGTPTGDHRDHPQVAVQDGKFKYLVCDDGERELYDLTADPGELVNLIDRHPDTAIRLAEYIETWREGATVYVPAKPYAGPAPGSGLMDSLRDLGYAGATPPATQPAAPTTQPDSD